MKMKIPYGDGTTHLLTTTGTLLIPFYGFSSFMSPNTGLVKTLQFYFLLLVTIIHEDLFKAVMSILNGNHTYYTSEKS